MSDDIHDLMERLDRAIPPHTPTVNGDDADPLVVVARRLAQGPEVRLSEAAINRIEGRLRQRVTAQHRTNHRRPVSLTPRRTWMTIARYAAAALLVVILAVTGLTSVSADSLPGDQLYPVKRAVEDVRLALAPANSEPGLRIDFAGRRLDEFQTLLLDRREFYPRALEEASDELNRVLDLLADGHGDRAELDPRLVMLARRQAKLVERATPLVKSAHHRQQLAAVTAENQAVQQRLAAEGTVPDFTPDVSEPPAPTPTAAPTVTPTLTPSPTATPTATATPTPTPTLTGTPNLREASTGATRTPPGHGATPGLGDDPPGHGGENPGVGNEGNPPGQDGKEKEKK